MKEFMMKWIILTLVNIRWFYFHISPCYVKFYVDEDCTEAYFQHTKTGETYCNFKWVD